MGPPRKSRSVNKRFSYDNEVLPIKDEENTNKKNQRKKKLSDMLGPPWSKEELEYFYEAYRKHGRDWRKVAAVLQNRSVEMVDAVYSLNKAYLSLPEGTASVAGFIAMMTDYYSNMEERDSDQERNNGVGTSRKPQKRKVHVTTSKGAVERFRLHSEAVPSDYGCLPLLKKKRTGGSRPRVVGKRTPRFPVSHSYENVKGDKYFSPTKKTLKLKADNEDVAHSIAMALAEASNKRSDSLMMTSPCQSTERVHDESDVASGWFVDNDTYVHDDDIEGSMEADNTDFATDKSKERTNAKGSQGRKIRFNKKENKHFDYIREACSGTESQNLGNLRRNFDVEVSDKKPSSASHGLKKRSNEARSRRDENSAFDALETLANLSLMISPEANGNGKDELVDNSHLPQASRQREKRKYSVNNTGKGNQSISTSEAAKNLVNDTKAASEAKESHQLITKVSRKRRKIVAPKILKAEAPIDTTLKESLDAEATQVSLGRRISQSSSPQLVKNVSETKHSNMRVKLRNRRKMYKPEALDVAKFSDGVVTDKSNVIFSNCLSNQLTRRWCAYEWFYSAIDDPWFAKKEFDEYLYHVGLGHVPRLTRLEWSVIRSSLGKPRRFSDQFLKEEKDKLNEYRDSVRTHYTEFRCGSRDGLPTDLARPLSVGQRVIAIYPKSKEIHDGTVLTVDHDRCRVQFDRTELGAEIIMDTDCMPLNPFENLPASLMRRTPIEKYFESLNEVKVNGVGKNQRLEGSIKFSSRDKLENIDEVASVKSDLQSRNEPRDIVSNHHATYSQIQAKEADVEAIAELTRALDKKEAVVLELRQMNDDVLESQNIGDFSLQDSGTFKKQYAAVLVQLNEANAQVSSALFRLRQRNTYQHNASWQRAVGDLTNHGTISSSSVNHTANNTQDSECHHDNEIVEISRTKARTMVDIAIQAMSSMKLNPTVEIEKAVDYVNDRIPLDDYSYIPPIRPNPIALNPVHSSFSLHEQLNSKPLNSSELNNNASVPSELITQCVATLFVIQKCTERQFPPAEIANILDSTVSNLKPYSPQNSQVYADIQKCMGIIKNQILALVPT